MAFDSLDISITGSGSDAAAAIQTVKSSLSGLAREANDAQDSVEEVGDEATSTSARLGPLAATAAASALSFSGLSSAALGASSSLTALSVSAGTVSAALAGVVTIAAPLVAVLGGIVTAGASVAGVFGLLAGATLATKFEELKSALAGVKEAILSAVEPMAETFLPVLLNLIERLPEVADQVVDALGPMDPFAEAFEDAGNAVLDLLPALASFASQLARETLPVLRDLASGAGNAVPNAIRRMLDVTRELGPLLLDLARAATDLIPPILEIGTVILRRVTPALTELVRRGADAIGMLTKFGKTDQGVTLLNSLRNAFKRIRPAIINFGKALQPIIKELVRILPDLIRTVGILTQPVRDTGDDGRDPSGQSPDQRGRDRPQHLPGAQRRDAKAHRRHRSGNGSPWRRWPHRDDHVARERARHRGERPRDGRRRPRWASHGRTCGRGRRDRRVQAKLVRPARRG